MDGGFESAVFLLLLLGNYQEIRYNIQMDKDIAISVKNVSKTFKIPHEKITSIRGAATSLFSRKRGYEEFKALDNVSFEVKKGEFFARLDSQYDLFVDARRGIIGRNGSGKSTLLKILTVILDFVIIQSAKTTRPDSLGMAGFVL